MQASQTPSQFIQSEILTTVQDYKNKLLQLKSKYEDEQKYYTLRFEEFKEKCKTNLPWREGKQELKEIYERAELNWKYLGKRISRTGYPFTNIQECINRLDEVTKPFDDLATAPKREHALRLRPLCNEYVNIMMAQGNQVQKHLSLLENFRREVDGNSTNNQRQEKSFITYKDVSDFYAKVVQASAQFKNMQTAFLDGIQSDISRLVAQMPSWSEKNMPQKIIENNISQGLQYQRQQQLQPGQRFGTRQYLAQIPAQMTISREPSSAVQGYRGQTFAEQSIPNQPKICPLSSGTRPAFSFSK